MIRFLFFSFLILIANIIYAQKESSISKIKLKDGSELNVLIIENVPGNYVKIMLPENTESKIEYKNIVYIKQKGFSYHAKNTRAKGFYLEGSGSFLFGKATSYGDPQLGASLGVSGNYRFNSYVNVGLGLEPTALFFSNNAFLIPVYMRFKGTITERRIAPVYTLDAGWSFVINDYGSTSIIETDGGWFARPAVGLQIDNYSISLGYQLQKITTTKENNWWWGADQIITEERLMKNINLSVNMIF